MEESPTRGLPRSAVPTSFANGARLVDGPFTTHNTTECRRFHKDGSQKDRSTKPFDSAKKPWKKPGSGEPAQMAYLMEEMARLKKKLKKSKKRVRNALMTRRIVISTVTRIVGPVARVDQ